MIKAVRYKEKPMDQIPNFKNNEIIGEIAEYLAYTLNKEKKVGSLKKSSGFKKVEVRPCKGDADIIQKEKDIEDLKNRIHSLRIKRDQYIYTWWYKK